MEESIILVFYVGVAGIRDEDISSTVHKIAKKITPDTFQGEIILIPVQSHDVRIECINPKYITEEKLIEEHNRMMKILNEELQYQINQAKDEKDV